MSIHYNSLFSSYPNITIYTFTEKPKYDTRRTDKVFKSFCNDSCDPALCRILDPRVAFCSIANLSKVADRLPMGLCRTAYRMAERNSSCPSMASPFSKMSGHSCPLSIPSYAPEI